MKTCTDCRIDKSLAEFYKCGKGLRPECISCSKARKERRRKDDVLLATVNSFADNILSRTFYQVNKPRNRVYKERGIKCLLGDNRAEIRETLMTHFAEDIRRLLLNDEKPSVDRIDPYDHYEVDNIRIVTLSENLRNVDLSDVSRKVEVTCPNGVIVIYPSVLAASKALKCKRDTIYAGAKSPGKNRRGLLFKIY